MGYGAWPAAGSSCRGRWAKCGWGSMVFDRLLVKMDAVGE